MIYEQLRDKLFADVEYPPELTRLIGVAEPWQAFCKLPEETKKKLAFPLRADSLDPAGYTLRSKAQGREDKEYFHAYGDLRSSFEESLAPKIPDQDVRSFIEYAQKVHDASHAFALHIGRELAKDVPELGALIDEGEIISLLRFLHYTNDEAADVIAGQHFDRSLYTLHLFESGPGLQFMNWDMQWTEAPIALGKTVVFNGYRMEYLTKGDLQKTWHRVSREDGVKDRMSAVLFVHSEKVPNYSNDLRAQDMTPSYSPSRALRSA